VEAALGRHRPWAVVNAAALSAAPDGDAFFTATYLPDIVRVALDLLIDGEAGTWHLASKGAVSRREMAQLFDVELAAQAPARRLVMLGSERAQLMPSLVEALLRQKELMAGRHAARPCPVAAE